MGLRTFFALSHKLSHRVKHFSHALNAMNILHKHLNYHYKRIKWSLIGEKHETSNSFSNALRERKSGIFVTLKDCSVVITVNRYNKNTIKLDSG